MIPIKLEFREGTLPYSLQQKIDALETEVELIRDANAEWAINYDTLQTKLDDAISALMQIRLDDGSMYDILADEALKRLMPKTVLDEILPGSSRTGAGY